MKHMLDYLVARLDKGLLGYQMGLPTIVQYWRSFEHLEAFANDASDPHVAVWRNYCKRVGTSSRTGIWHETYLVRAGEYEAIYGNMPPFGLGKAGRLVPLADARTARGYPDPGRDAKNMVDGGYAVRVTCQDRPSQYADSDRHEAPIALAEPRAMQRSGPAQLTCSK